MKLTEGMMDGEKKRICYFPARNIKYIYLYHMQIHILPTSHKDNIKIKLVG